MVTRDTAGTIIRVNRCPIETLNLSQGHQNSSNAPEMRAPGI